MSSKPKLSRKSSLRILAEGTEEELEAMKEMFLICDKNGDGEVDLEEFVSVFQEMKISASSDDVVELFGDLDIDNSGTVTLDEFLGGVKRMKNVLSGSKVEKKPVKSNASVLAEEVQRVEQENQAMKYYLQDMVKRGVDRAYDEATKGNISASIAILKTIDLPLLMDTEEYMGGDILWDETIKKYKQTKTKIRKVAKGM